MDYYLKPYKPEIHVNKKETIHPAYRPLEEQLIAES